MKKGDMLLLLWRIPLDFLAVIAAWFLAYAIRPHTDLIPGIQIYFPEADLPLFSFFVPFAIATAGAFVILLAFLGRYQFTEKFEPLREFFRLFLGVFLWGMLIIAWYALFRHELIFSRIVLFHTLLFSLIFTFSMRLFLHSLRILKWRRGKNRKRILLFGIPEHTTQLKKTLRSYPQFQVNGVFTEKDLPRLVQVQKKSDELWRCDPQTSPKIARALQEICADKQLIFRFVPHGDDLSFARMELELIGDTPILLSLPAALTLWQRIWKRVFDTILAFVALFLLSPFFLIIALLIKIDSRGPVFFKSRRLGREAKPFIMWKFRSMIADAERQKNKLLTKSHRDGPLFKIKNDPRITRLGRILRRFSLDELPNLINVLKGHMSLIGPRPHLPEEVQKYQKWQKRVLMMKPGITGLAQTSGRSDLPFADEVRLDLYYLENWNFWLDLKILLKTIAVVLSPQGAD